MGTQRQDRRAYRSTRVAVVSSETLLGCVLAVQSEAVRAAYHGCNHVASAYLVRAWKLWSNAQRFGANTRQVRTCLRMEEVLRRCR